MRKTSRSKYRSEFPGDFEFDFKDPLTLARFIMDGGKIIPARISKLSIAQQKSLAAAIKRARNISLLPLGSPNYDRMERPESISAAPFSLE